jgi:decaprenylphospho-beta-D-erythro-pentofuranosid-2-ulose 2-reductase
MSGKWERGLVIGASSGLGEAIARELAGSGTRVALVARRAEVLHAICTEINANGGPNSALAFAGDVRDIERAETLFNEIVQEMGGLDLVVYAAGMMPPTDLNNYRTDADVDAISTNFTGAVAWLNPAAREFATKGSGTIIGISSVAGERGRRANPVYNASKAALSIYLESLRNRLSSRGVRVITVKPGYVQTAMIKSRSVFPPAISAPSAARKLLDAAAAGRRVVYVPWWWRLIIYGLKLIPSPLMERFPI